LKDRNFDKMLGSIKVEEDQARKISSTLFRDAEFLRDHKIIDYSIILFVIKKDEEFEYKLGIIDYL